MVDTRYWTDNTCIKIHSGVTHVGSPDRKNSYQQDVHVGLLYLWGV